jgi:hypothetical protein
VLPPEVRIGSRPALDLIDALSVVGVDVGGVCREVGVDTARLHNGESVPGARVLALLEAAERWTLDSCIGLHAGERSEPRGPMAYLLISCAGLEQGLRQAARFVALTISTLRVDVESVGDRASVVYHLGDKTLATHRHLIDYVLMANLRSLWRAAGERFPLREVHLCFPDPGDDEEARAFGCPVYFAQAETRWVLDSRQLMRTPPLPIRSSRNRSRASPRHC